MQGISPDLHMFRNKRIQITPVLKNYSPYQESYEYLFRNRSKNKFSGFIFGYDLPVEETNNSLCI